MHPGPGHVVTLMAEAEDVRARMPFRAEAAGVTLTLGPSAGEHWGRTSFAGTWTAQAANGVATVAVAAASPRASQVEVWLGAAAAGPRSESWTVRRRAAAAAALAGALAAAIEDRPPKHAAPRPPRHVARTGVATLTAVALAVVVFVANLMGPPRPISVEEATARFREAAAAPAAAAAAPARDGRRAAGAPGRDGRRAAGAAPGTRQMQDGGLERRESPRSTVRGRTRGAGAGQTPVVVAERTHQPVQARQPMPSAPKRARDRGVGARPRSVVPDEGVYSYDTDGWEEVDAPGGHREFPRETSQTVLHTDCGYRVRWDPMEERWDDNSLCVVDGMPQPVELDTYRSFFGRSVEQHFSCRPAPAPAGALWAARCRSDDTTLHNVAWPLGARTMTVGGAPVDVTGIRLESQLTGANSGTRRSQLWHARHGGVLVHTEVAADLVVEGPFGHVDYRERYTLHLQSLRAHR